MDILERDIELGRLAALLGEASDGAGRVVLIRGEAGIGKTTLVREFLGSIDDEAYVLAGACDDLLTPRELGPLWDMSLDQPDLAESLESGDRQRIYSAAIEIISRGLKPTVLVMEDVHWADDATFDLIKFVGRRIDRSQGLLLLTYRDEELDTDHRLRFVMGDLPPHAVERIALAQRRGS